MKDKLRAELVELLGAFQQTLSNEEHEDLRDAIIDVYGKEYVKANRIYKRQCDKLIKKLEVTEETNVTH